MTAPSLDRVRGALLGGAIGDMLGAPNEARNDTPVPVDSFDPALATITDDTQLTLVVGRALVDGAGTIDEARLGDLLVEWLPVAIGAGENTSAAVARLSAGFAPAESGLSSASNGAAMRIAPVGLLHADPAVLVEQTRAASWITHAHETAVSAAHLLASIVSWLARRTTVWSAVEMRRVALDALVAFADPELPRRDAHRGRSPTITLRGELDEVLDNLHRSPEEWFGARYSGAFVPESLPAAMFCFLRSPDDPREAIRAAAEHTRDADTVAAMAGTMAGAWCGADRLPPGWISWLPSERRQDLERLAEELHALAG